jgi:hypothetical protein
MRRSLLDLADPAKAYICCLDAFVSPILTGSPQVMNARSG